MSTVKESLHRLSDLESLETSEETILTKFILEIQCDAAKAFREVQEQKK